MNFSKKAIEKKNKAMAFYSMRRRGTFYSFLFRAAFFLFILVFLSIVGLGIGAVQGIYHSTPPMTIDSLKSDGNPSTVYDSEGEEILSFDEDHFRYTKASLNEVPQNLQNAIIVIEDPEFYQHDGADVYSILNGLFSSFIDKDVYGNANLISEQVIENNSSDLLVDTNLFSRMEYKMRLFFQSISLEQNSSKPEILEYYLNTVGFGDEIIGVSEAAKTYFGKDVSDLSLSECVSIAAVISNPQKYSPLTNKEANHSRCVLILEKMLNQGYITQKEMDEALKEDSYQTVSSSDNRLRSNLPEFTQAALSQLCRELKQKYHINDSKFTTLMLHGGLKLYTTQDTSLQQTAEGIVYDDANYAKGITDASASLTIMDHSTGQVKVIVGGDEDQSSIMNSSTEIIHQPGSLFHVLATYAPGLDTNTLTLASVYEDSPYQYLDSSKKVTPRNGTYDGLTTIRKAFSSEMNIVAAKAQSDLTAQVSYDYLTKMGFEHLVVSSLDETGNAITDIQQSICSGNLIQGVTNMEVTQAVSAFGNSGYTVEPILYTKLVDSHDRILLEKETTSKKTFSSSTAFLVTDALKVKNGKSEYGSELAYLHGSNEEETDYWSVGYTPELTTTLWLGYDDDRSFESKGTERRLFNQVMKAAISKNSVSSFDKPSDIATADICQESGKLAVDSICNNDPRGSTVLTEYFAKNTVPTTTCNIHVEVTICKESGMLISNDCPKEDYEKRIYLVLPSGVSNTSESPYLLPKKYRTDQRCTIHSHKISE